MRLGLHRDLSARAVVTSIYCSVTPTARIHTFSLHLSSHHLLTTHLSLLSHSRHFSTSFSLLHFLKASTHLPFSPLFRFFLYFSFDFSLSNFLYLSLAFSLSYPPTPQTRAASGTHLSKPAVAVGVLRFLLQRQPCFDRYRFSKPDLL